jgi:hypothetical protein
MHHDRVAHRAALRVERLLHHERAIVAARREHAARPGALEA